MLLSAGINSMICIVHPHTSNIYKKKKKKRRRNFAKYINNMKQKLRYFRALCRNKKARRRLGEKQISIVDCENIFLMGATKFQEVSKIDLFYYTSIGQAPFSRFRTNHHQQQNIALVLRK